MICKSCKEGRDWIAEDRKCEVCGYTPTETIEVFPGISGPYCPVCEKKAYEERLLEINDGEEENEV